MIRCSLNKIGSVTRRLGLRRQAVLGTEIPAVAGTAVACRVLSSKTTYQFLENVHGRMVPLRPGDVLAGVLGRRDALHGFAGRVPDQVRVGDRLQLLNAGGVIGVGAGTVPGFGAPFELEVLGSLLEFPQIGVRVGTPANIAGSALARASLPPHLPAVVLVVGTSMDSGKTTAASTVVSGLTAAQHAVAGGKLTGVSLLRDTLHMKDNGADPVASFTDFGVVTTDEENAVSTGHALLAHLAEHEPELIVLEMGDGLFGSYGVKALLADPAFRGAVRALLLCANDPVGAWGAVQHLEESCGLRPDLISGPVTDSPVGRRYCRSQLALPAWNAMEQGTRLAGAVEQVLLGERVLA